MNPKGKVWSVTMTSLFAVTLFLSSTLLFWVQPMFAKMVLPMLGGAPAVWNICMVFFQASLLGGYVYADLAIKWFGMRRQAVLHLGFLLLPLLTLPIRVPAGWSPPVDASPVLWLLKVLSLAVGLPFFLLSASAPMLQKWFSSTDHPSAKDPYFLYVASNLGSMLGLLAYPIALEPSLRSAEQSSTWTFGYWAFVLLTVGCAVVLWTRPLSAEQRLRLQSPRAPDANSGVTEQQLTGRQKIGWVVLSFAPASLLLGVTAHLSTDIVAIPLLWVIPLALYLFSFVLVFARKQILSYQWMVRRLPFLILASAIAIFSHATQPAWLLVPLHLLTFFVAAMVCHGELARQRPPTQYLTQFYLWLSVGGVLGGLFNALVAPLLFNQVLEYPLALVVVALLRQGTNWKSEKSFNRWLDLLSPLALGLATAGVIVALQANRLVSYRLTHLLIFGISSVVCLSFARRPIRFGLGVGALMVASTFYTGPYGNFLHTQRSFFGVHRVIFDQAGKYHLLLHGTTLHGTQSLDPTRRLEPLSYFYPTGPIGQLFSVLGERLVNPRVAVIGLGSGSLACYGKSQQSWTFYEIDPVVERLARDRKYFTYLKDCAPRVNVILGDARLSLAKEPNQHFGLIILDAFSSDAIPTHLLTREAIELYLSKLAEGGIIALHISNRHVNLRPVIGNLARNMGLSCLLQDDIQISEFEMNRGKEPSTWAVLARHTTDLGKLAQDARWKPLQGLAETNVWTDDFSNILSVMNWNF
jgi:hypothetical protein